MDKIKQGFRKVFPGGGYTRDTQRPTTAEHLLNIGTAGILGRNRTAWNRLEREDEDEAMRMERADEASKRGFERQQQGADKDVSRDYQRKRDAETARIEGMNAEVAARMTALDRAMRAIYPEMPDDERQQQVAIMFAGSDAVSDTARTAGGLSQQRGLGSAQAQAAVMKAEADAAAARQAGERAASMTGSQDPTIAKGALDVATAQGQLRQLPTRQQIDDRRLAFEASLTPLDLRQEYDAAQARQRYVPSGAGGVFDALNREVIGQRPEHAPRAVTVVPVGVDVEGNPRYTTVDAAPENVHMYDGGLTPMPDATPAGNPNLRVPKSFFTNPFK